MEIFAPVILIIIALFLSNCTPAGMVFEDSAENVKTSKLIVSRGNKFLFIGVPAIFGYDEKDKVQLWSGDRSEISVPVGRRGFFVRSNQADRPFKLNVEIKEGKPTCLVINPESKPALKLVLFPLYWFSHAFKLEQREGLCQ
jgi:hypothetical protein